MTYKVEFSVAAAEDLEQLFDFALQREMEATKTRKKVYEAK